VPSSYFGQIEIEAGSEEEATRMAMERAHEIDWEDPRFRLHGSEIEVFEIECDDPPEGALLSRPGSGEPDISAFFEDAAAPAGNPNGDAPVSPDDKDGHQ
jgi:hypothetical protein